MYVLGEEELFRPCSTYLVRKNFFDLVGVEVELSRPPKSGENGLKILTFLNDARKFIMGSESLLWGGSKTSF